VALWQLVFRKSSPHKRQDSLVQRLVQFIRMWHQWPGQSCYLRLLWPVCGKQSIRRKTRSCLLQGQQIAYYFNELLSTCVYGPLQTDSILGSCMSWSGVWNIYEWRKTDLWKLGRHPVRTTVAIFLATEHNVLFTQQRICWHRQTLNVFKSFIVEMHHYFTTLNKVQYAHETSRCHKNLN